MDTYTQKRLTFFFFFFKLQSHKSQIHGFVFAVEVCYQ